MLQEEGIRVFHFRRVLSDEFILNGEHNGIAALCQEDDYRLLLLLHTGKEPKYLVQHKKENKGWVNLTCLDKFNGRNFDCSDLKNLRSSMSDYLKEFIDNL